MLACGRPRISEGFFTHSQISSNPLARCNLTTAASLISAPLTQQQYPSDLHAAAMASPAADEIGGPGESSPANQAADEAATGGATPDDDSRQHDFTSFTSADIWPSFTYGVHGITWDVIHGRQEVLARALETVIQEVASLHAKFDQCVATRTS